MTDYFSTFGIDRTFGEGRDSLEARFHELQSESHPDRHVNAEAERRETALSESSDINAAYKTLREPLPRARHLLVLYGYPIGDQKQVPASLLMTVMEAQEKISDLESAHDGQTKQRIIHELGAVAEGLEMKRMALDEERTRIAKEWDTAMHSNNEQELSNPEREQLGRMSQLLAERAYLETLHWSVQAARQGKPAFIQH
ncbi:MAG TPA: Fe-S protein assembly co-chaperone HscB [Candidatus Kapabacteria bacterium]|jgi:molecular chaperone HscB|nr:Fe-S protein assembly co-chaperone HscB [Candidatus Kapabacteria bacterium]